MGKKRQQVSKGSKGKQSKSEKNSKRRKGRTKTNKGWQKYFDAWQNILGPKGVYMRDVDGDGNCLFRSISDQVEGNESNHRHYRDLAIEHIRENSDMFKLFLLEDETIEDYLKDIDEDGTWGGHFELVALSEALNCNFCLHMKEQAPVIIHGSLKDTKNKVRTYHLAYHVDEHYSSIRKKGDEGNTPAAEIDLDSVMEKKQASKASDDEDEKDKKQGSTLKRSLLMIRLILKVKVKQIRRAIKTKISKVHQKIRRLICPKRE